MAQTIPPSPAQGGNETEYWAAVIKDAAQSGKKGLKLNGNGLTYLPLELFDLVDLTSLQVDCLLVPEQFTGST